MREPIRATPADASDLTHFLRSVDLTFSGLTEPDVQLWMDLDPDGRITATAGLELAGPNALIRSVGIAKSLRLTGRGTELAQFVIAQAQSQGATRVWAMSRRSGPFWQKLGFVPADVHQLAAALLTTAQVREFGQTGQLDYETAWVRDIEE